MYTEPFYQNILYNEQKNAICKKHKNLFLLYAIPSSLIQPLYPHGFLPEDKSFSQDFFMSCRPCTVRCISKFQDKFCSLDFVKQYKSLKSKKPQMSIHSSYKNILSFFPLNTSEQGYSVHYPKYIESLRYLIN